MSVAVPARERRVVNKSLLVQLIDEQNSAMGFIPDPTATGETAQKMALAFGIVPEENILSSGIISARDEE